MQGLQELRAANDRAAERELRELRSDTIKGLRYTFDLEGETGVIRLLIAAGIVAPETATLRRVA